MSTAKRVVLAAGGTGGHLFPAEALSRELMARGVDVILVTDERAEAFAGTFPASAIHSVPAATPSGGGLLSKAKAGLTLVRGVVAARSLLRKLKPDLVIGFGGYPTVPPVIAASTMKIATIIHEQNAVMGRANRFMAARATQIATGFAQVKGIAAALHGKCQHVGNPVRPAVIEASALPYALYSTGGRFNLLVTGGSQGARVMADVVPAAIALLEPELRAKIALTQQARGEDEVRVRSAYAKIGFGVDVQPFFKDLPKRIALSQLVIGRSGASTVAELAVIGRPSILVPLPGSLDQDQAANAAVLADAGGAIRIMQAEFTPAWLAKTLRKLLAEPQSLTAMASAAKSAAIPDAAKRLADMVMAALEAPAGQS